MNAFSFTQRFSARFLAVLALFSLIAGTLPLQAFADHDSGSPYAGEILGKEKDGGTIDKIRICHMTSSETNPYTNPEVNISSFFSGGHDNDADDIIPPFHYNNGSGTVAFSGTNWDTAGQAIYNDDCGEKSKVSQGSNKEVITVVKTLVNAPTDVDESDFTLSVGGVDIAFEDDGSNDVDVILGNYTVTEKSETGGAVKVNGHDYTVTYSDECDGTLSKDSNLTCTITNTYVPPTSSGTGVITVAKTLVNAPAGVTADDFTFSVQGKDVTFEADGSNDVDVNLGSYTVTEKNVTSGTVNVEGKNFNVSYSQGCDGTLTKDSTVSCTITNTYVPEGTDLDVISVVKTLVNAPQGVTTDDFKFSVQGKDITFEADGSNDVDVFLGSYTVTEKTEFGGVVHVDGNTYTVSYSAGCTGTLTEDSNATCTITNTFVPDTVVMNTCVLPDANGDADNITFGETYDPSGTELQDILNDYGYTYVDADTDDVNTQVWNFASSSTGSTTFNVKVLAKIALNNQLFGYYFENNPSSFVPLFEVGAHSQTVAPNVAVGSTIQVTIPSNASFGFAINTEGLNSNTWYSQEALNAGGKDNLAVYNPSTNKYILAFEDLRDENEDNDYQDLVLELTLVECIPESGGGGNGGGGQVAGDYVSICPAPASNLLTNGSFEDPVADANAFAGGFYEIFASIPSWVATNSIELWNNIFGGGSSGPQNAELDVNSPTTISQTINTIPGASYELRFDLKARSDASDLANNSVIASADGNTVVSTSSATTTWTTYGGTFLANDASTTIALADNGTANGTGTLVDNAVLCLVVDPTPVPEPLACTVNVHGDTSTMVNASGAIVVTDQPSVWVDNIVGSLAQWIWSVVSGGPTDPVNNETEVFTKTFDWNGPVTNATLKISADNTYSVVLNGEEVASSTDGDNFTNTDQIDLDGFIDQGTNTLTISVTNSFNGGTTTASTAGQNPAGLLYDLTVVGNNSTDCTPEGGGGGGGNPNVLSCSITANDTSIRRGNDVTLTWDSNLATTASLDNGIGAVAVDGSRLVQNIRSDTTYTMTVSNGTATTTCGVTVDTSSGGGGGGGSRNNSNNNNNNNGGGSVLGASDNNNSNGSNADDRGFGSVLGEQVSLLPEGAPNAGAGGTSPLSLVLSTLPFVAFLRRK